MRGASPKSRLPHWESRTGRRELLKLDLGSERREPHQLVLNLPRHALQNPEAPETDRRPPRRHPTMGDALRVGREVERPQPAEQLPRPRCIEDLVLVARGAALNVLPEKHSARPKFVD